MDCWGGDSKDDDRAESRACSELAWAAVIFAVLYVVTLVTWKVCS